MKIKITLSKIILISGFIFSGMIAISNTTPSAKTVTTETEKTIRTYFKFPQVLLPHLN